MKLSPIFTSILPSFRKINVFAIFGALLLLSSCNYSDVEVTDVRSIQINSLDKNGIDLSGKIRINNPNDYKIRIKSTDADLFLDGRMAGKAHLKDKIVVPANFDDYLPVNIYADFTEGGLGLVPIILGAAVKRSANIKVVGNLRAGTFIYSKKIDFEYAHKAEF